MTRFTKYAAEQWSQTSPEEKQKYAERAKKARELYLTELEAYRNLKDPMAGLKRKFKHLQPKKPQSAYMQYITNPEVRSAAKEDCAKDREAARECGVSAGRLSAKLANQWKAMPREEKMVLEAAAEKDMAEFEERWEEWEKTPEYKELTQLWQAQSAELKSKIRTAREAEKDEDRAKTAEAFKKQKEEDRARSAKAFKKQSSVLAKAKAREVVRAREAARKAMIEATKAKNKALIANRLAATKAEKAQRLAAVRAASAASAAKLPACDPESSRTSGVRRGAKGTGRQGARRKIVSMTPGNGKMAQVATQQAPAHPGTVKREPFVAPAPLAGGASLSDAAARATAAASRGGRNLKASHCSAGGGQSRPPPVKHEMASTAEFLVAAAPTGMRAGAAGKGPRANSEGYLARAAVRARARGELPPRNAAAGAPPAPAVKRELTTTRGMMRTCPQGHLLQDSFTPCKDCFCELCGVFMDLGAPVKVCALCNWGICFDGSKCRPIAASSASAPAIKRAKREPPHLRDPMSQTVVKAAPSHLRESVLEISDSDAEQEEQLSRLEEHFPAHVAPSHVAPSHVNGQAAWSTAAFDPCHDAAFRQPGFEATEMDGHYDAMQGDGDIVELEDSPDNFESEFMDTVADPVARSRRDVSPDGRFVPSPYDEPYISPEVMREAQSLDYGARLRDLASRRDVASNGFSSLQLLDALKRSRGHVNTARSYLQCAAEMEARMEDANF